MPAADESVEGEWGKGLKYLRKYQKEWLRLQGKDFVYQIDVELDQRRAFEAADPAE